MALYLDGSTYALLRSGNLTDWSVMQHIELEGDSECPDFYPLESPDGRRWVFSGASDRYYIGGFDNGRYAPSQKQRALHDGKNVLYAAQTFSGMPGMRRVRLSWNTSQVAGNAGMPFNCEMSVPADMSIRRCGQNLALCVYPVQEFDSLRVPYRSGGDGACDIEAVLQPAEGASFTVFGHTEPLDGAPADEDGTVKIRIIADRTGYEAYFGGGEYYIARGFVRDAGLPPEAHNAG